MCENVHSRASTLQLQRPQVERTCCGIALNRRHLETMIPQLARVVPIESERHRIVARGHVVDPELAVPIHRDREERDVRAIPGRDSLDPDRGEIPAGLPRSFRRRLSLPTTGRPFPPRSMWTVFPERKVALILPDKVTSMAPLVDHEGDLAADPPGAGDHSLEHEPPVRPSGRAVRRVDDGP